MNVKQVSCLQAFFLAHLCRWGSCATAIAPLLPTGLSTKKLFQLMLLPSNQVNNDKIYIITLLCLETGTSTCGVLVYLNTQAHRGGGYVDLLSIVYMHIRFCVKQYIDQMVKGNIQSIH